MTQLAHQRASGARSRPIGDDEGRRSRCHTIAT
jgi:hypothetical protein